MTAKNKQKQKKSRNFSLFIYAILLGVLVIINNKFTAEDKLEQIEEKVDEKLEVVESLTPYLLKDEMRKNTVIIDFYNSSKNSKPTKTIRTNFNRTGIVTGGYLYIKSSINNRQAEDLNSDIYLKLLSDKDKYGIGGHISSEKSLSTPITDNYSEYLYPLSEIPFKTKLGSSIIKFENWLELLNEDNNPFTTLAFYSTEGAGHIHEVSLYYECLENTDCSLEIIN